MGTTTHRRRLPGLDVHCFRFDRPIPEGIREEQLPQHKVGTIFDEG